MSRRIAQPARSLEKVVCRPHAERLSAVHRRLDSSAPALAVGKHRKALLVYPAPSRTSRAAPVHSAADTWSGVRHGVAGRAAWLDTACSQPSGFLFAPPSRNPRHSTDCRGRNARRSRPARRSAHTGIAAGRDRRLVRYLSSSAPLYSVTGNAKQGRLEVSVSLRHPPAALRAG